MRKRLSRRRFVKGAAMTSAAIVGAVHSLHAEEPVDNATKTGATCIFASGMKNQKFRNDGLCNAAVTIHPYQLLSIVCILGGAKCPLMESGKATEVIRQT